MLFSTKDPITGPTFTGFAWVGANLVVEAKGAETFENSTGSSIPPGEDGCYATIRKNLNGWEVGTDYRGLTRLFLYRSGSHWAIGTSLYEVVKYVRLQEWALTPLEDSLTAYLNRGGFSTQLSSLDAHFEQIQLIPSFATIQVSENDLTINFRRPENTVDYETALSGFVNIWKARLATLVNCEESFIKFDLSGGIDSRTVIAFALENGEVLTNPERAVVNSSTSPALVKDLRVAEIIATKYGFDLNSPSAKRDEKYKADLAINGWKRHSLGVYSPVYLYGFNLTPTFVHAHGAGGGNFRPTYKNINSKINAHKKNLSADHFSAWSNRIHASLETLASQSNGPSPEVLHYREFRNRFHFGHRPHQNVVFMPLESKLTDLITDRLDDRDARQIYFDIMESLSPGLMSIEYDKAEKFPTESNIRDLTQVRPIPMPTGMVYRGHESSVESGIAPSQAFSLWIESAAALLMEKHVANRMPVELFDAAQEALTSWRKNKVRPSSNGLGMIGLSHAYSIDFLTNPESQV